MGFFWVLLEALPIFFGLLFLPRPITHRHLKSGEPKLHIAISKGLLNNKNESDEKKVFVVRMFFT